jgi:hypothetical protein
MSDQFQTRAVDGGHEVYYTVTTKDAQRIAENVCAFLNTRLNELRPKPVKTRPGRSLATACPHTDKPAVSRGLCANCYSAQRRRNAGIPEKKAKVKVTACPHTDRQHGAHGLCRSCYYIKRRKQGVPRTTVYASACDHTDRLNYANGKCRSCYQRDKCAPRRKVRKTALQRFHDRVVVQPNGCWTWTGAHKSDKQGGYGMFTPPRPAKNVKPSPVHAVAWAYANIRGLEAPKRNSGLELSHQPDRCELLSCCVNPDHVEPETHKDNCNRIPEERRSRALAIARKHIDYKAAGMARRRTHCKRGHELSGDNLRTGKRQCKACHLAAQRAHINRNSWLAAMNRAFPMPVSEILANLNEQTPCQ